MHCDILITKRNLLITDNLIRLMAFACYKYGISYTRFGNSKLNCFFSIDNSDGFTIRVQSCFHLLENSLRIFCSRVIIRQNNLISPLPRQNPRLQAKRRAW